MKKGEIKYGFTIIEVVLVLAVAGLIFVMVFVALPALQRGQRDNSRRDDMMNFISKVKKYQTSNRGALPGETITNINNKIDVLPDENGAVSGASSTWAVFYHDYLGSNFIDPNGVHYKLSVMLCNTSAIEDKSCAGYSDWLSKLATTSFGTATAPNDYRIMVVLQAKCKGTEAVGSSNPRNLAIVYRLEGSGAYCFNT